MKKEELLQKLLDQEVTIKTQNKIIRKQLIWLHNLRADRKALNELVVFQKHRVNALLDVIQELAHGMKIKVP